MSDRVESAREPGHVRVIRCGVDWKACVPSEMKIPIAVFVINCGIVYKHTHTRTYSVLTTLEFTRSVYVTRAPVSVRPSHVLNHTHTHTQRST